MITRILKKKIARSLLVGVLSGVSVFSPVSFAGSSPQSFTYQGRFLNAAGTAPLLDVVDIKIGVYAPAPATCLLYEESHVGIDLSVTQGMFAVQAGSVLGSAARTASDPGLSMSQIFANTGTQLRADDSATTGTCVGGYTPLPGDKRVLRATLTDPTITGTPVVLGDQFIMSAPQALVAETLQGITLNQFFQVSGAVTPYSTTKTNLDLIFGTGTSGVTDATSLHNHDSVYAKLAGSGSITLSSNSFLGLGTRTADPAGGTLTAADAGKTWYDTTTNQVKFWNGTAVQILATSSSSGVSSFNTRTGAVTLSSADVTTALGYTPLKNSSDSMSGTLGVGGAPAANVQFQSTATAATQVGAVIKGAVTQSADLLDFQNSAGGTLSSFDKSGMLTLAADPTANLGAATKQYVDTALAGKQSSTLTSGNIFVGNASNLATGVAMSGDATISNTGAVTVGKLQGRTVASTAPNANDVLHWNGTSSQWEPVAASNVSQWTTSGTSIYYSGGNVGIGTIAPADPFSVNPLQYNAGTASQALTTITGVGTTWTAAMVGSQFVFGTGLSAGTVTAVASPTSLTVSTSQTVASGGYSIYFTGLNVNASGNLGVGTAAPGYKIDVQGGQVNASGGLCIAGVCQTSWPAAVTSVSGTAPISVANGTTTPAISISQANATTNGYLSSADWSTFNGKENVLTFSAPLSRSVNTVSVTQATSVANGYLSSTDWTIFNNKLSATLTSGNIFVGSGTNVATGVAMSGDATISNTGALTLATTGVTAGTYPKVTVDTKGRVTAGSSLAAADIPNPAGDVTGTYAATTVSKLQGRTMASTAPNANDVLHWNGTSSQWEPVAASTMSQWTTSSPNIYYNTGKVGIGTPTPGSPLDVQLTNTATSGSTSLENVVLTVNPGATSTATNIGLSLNVFNPTPGAIGYGTMRGISSSVSQNGLSGATASTLEGANISGYSTGGTVTTLNGSNITAMGQGSVGSPEAITNLKGQNVLTELDGPGASVTNMYGIYSSLSSSGVVTSGSRYGIYLYDMSASTTSTTNSYGVYVNDSNSGTVGSHYGIYLQSGATATNNYGVYQATSGDKNYFAGNIGVGAVSPSAALQLKAGTAAVGGAPLKLTSGVNLTTPEAGAIEYDGTSLYYTDSTNARRTLATTSTSTFTGVSSVSNSTGNITLAAQSSTGSVLVNSNTSSTSTSTGALVVTGGVGVSGALNAGGAITTSSTVTANNNISATSPTAATAVANQNSPSLFLTANYWNGTSSAVDQWGIQDVLGTGTNPSSTLQFSHSGSSGASQYAFMNGNIGIGTTSPGANVDVTASTSDPAVRLTTYNLATGGVADFVAYAARGSSAAPSAVLANDRLVDFRAHGYNGSAWTAGAEVAIEFDATENWSTTANGTRMTFATTPNGTSSRVERMRIDQNGNVGIGTSAPAGALSVSPLQYNTGTAAQSLTAVTGTGTTWTAAMVGSQLVYANGVSAGTITAVGSATSLTVSTSQTVAAQAYSINYTGLNVTSTGDVGVGITSPGEKMHVYANDARSIVQASNLSPNTGFVVYGGPDLTNDPSIRMGIDSTGIFFGTAGYAGIASRANGTGTVFPMLLSTAPNRFDLVITTSGKVGVGTSVPAGPLSVSPLQYNTGTASQSLTTVTGVGTAWTSAMVGSQLVFANGVSAGMITAVASATSLTVTSSQTVASSNYSINYTGLNVTSTGNLGVGTTSPLTVVHGRQDVDGPAYLSSENENNTANARTGAWFISATAEGGIGITPANSTYYGTQFAGRLGVVAASASTSVYGRPAGGLDLVADDIAADTRFYTGGHATTNERMRINSSGNVGIGTTAPDSLMTISGNSAMQAPGASYDGTTLHITGANASKNRVVLDSFGTNLGGRFSQRAARGTASAPTALLQYDVIGSYGVGGYGTTGYGPTSSQILFQAGENWTDTAQGSYMSFYTSALGTTSGAEKMRIDTNGNVGISNAAPAALLHVGSALTAAGSAVAQFTTATGTCTMTPATTGTGMACSSDERLKRNIAEVSDEFALEQIIQLQAVTYEFKKDPNATRHTGYIAQALRKVAPEFVREDSDGFLQIYYDGLIPWITESIKALYGKLMGHERDIASLKQDAEAKDKQIQSLKEESAAMKAYLCGKDPAAPICK